MKTRVCADPVSPTHRLCGKSSNYLLICHEDPAPISVEDCYRIFVCKKREFGVPPGSHFPGVPRRYPGCTRGTAGPLPAARSRPSRHSESMLLSRILCNIFVFICALKFEVPHRPLPMRELPALPSNVLAPAAHKRELVAGTHDPLHLPLAVRRHFRRRAVGCWRHPPAPAREVVAGNVHRLLLLLLLLLLLFVFFCCV